MAGAQPAGVLCSNGTARGANDALSLMLTLLLLVRRKKTPKTGCLLVEYILACIDAGGENNRGTLLAMLYGSALADGIRDCFKHTHSLGRVTQQEGCAGLRRCSFHV